MRLAELAQFPFILFEEGFPLNDLILAACRNKGIRPKIVARGDQVDFIFELVAANVGIAFLPRVLAEERPHQLVQCVPLDEPRIKWRVALAWRHGGYLSHVTRPACSDRRPASENRTMTGSVSAAARAQVRAQGPIEYPSIPTRPARTA